jgi:tetratricopeptide (TPR) repeat protein
VAEAGYLTAAEVAGHRTPVWPYWLFLALAVLGVVVMLIAVISKRRGATDVENPEFSGSDFSEGGERPGAGRQRPIGPARLQQLDATSNGAVLSNLPRRSTPNLVDRRAELEQLRRLIKDTPGSCVLIDGTAGTGKTTLALQVCHELLEDQNTAFASIIWLSGKTSLLGTDREALSAIGVSGLDDLTASMALTLGRLELLQLPPRQRATGISAAMSASRSLVVLDNCEAITDTTVVTYLKTLPETCSLLITSRYRIDAPDRMHLTPLNLSDAKALVRQEIRQRNIEEDSELIDNLAEASGGLPLAINWLVARRAFEAPRIAPADAKIDDDSLLRHLFDASLAAAGPSGTAPLLLLSQAPSTVPRSVFTSALAAAGLGASQLARVASSLLALNLIEYDSESDRYSVLPVIKRFLASDVERTLGLGDISPAELTGAYAAALSDFLRQQANTLWNVGYSHNDWDLDRTNVQITLDKMLTEGSYPRAADLADAFYSFALTFGHFNDFLAYTAELLTHQDELQGEVIVALRAKRASILLHSGDAEAAAIEIDLAEPVYRSLSPATDELVNLMYFVRGTIAVERGSAEAETILREAIDFERHRGVVWARLGFQGWLGQHLTRTGRIAEAERLLGETLAECETTGDLRTSTFIQVGLARLRLARHAYGDLIQAVSDILPIADEFGEDHNRAHLNLALAEAYCRTGRPADAAQHLSIARDLYIRLGIAPGVISCDALAAELSAEAGEPSS